MLFRSWLESRGVDAVIAQGLEAGGHRGMFETEDLTTQSGTLALLPQIVRAVSVPVIAAGGIADASSVKAALALGAAGVQAGTAYLLCPEATTSAIHREALASERAQHTAVTNVFTGRPARGIVNRVVREVGPISADDMRFDTRGAKFLRGFQTTDSDGRVRFTTIYPGAYPGRAVHIHFKVRAQAAGRDAEFTSQLYFDDALTDRVHAAAPYAGATRRMRNEQDGLYRRGGRELTLDVTPVDGGYRAAYDVGVRVA